VTAANLRLTVLGCSGTYAGPGQACSGYLVEAAGTRVLLDAGPGTLGALQRHVALTDLDAVVVSHAHPDHWLELPVLRNALRYVIGRDDLPVFGTAGTRELTETVVGGDLAPTFRWSTIDASAALEVGPLQLRFSRTDHPVETLAVRVDAGGRSLAYSADTGAAWSVAELGDGIDLFVCEASLTEAEEDRVQHLSAAQAGAMGAAAGVGRLVITHLVPGVEPEAQRTAAARHFGADVELAESGRTFEA
jgi:ribonuclease BN (tRNA processing enzyme)